jgi:hypothetical protein
MIVLKHEHFKQIRHQLTLDHLLVESLEHVRNTFHRFDADVGLFVIQQLAYFRYIRLLQTWAALESLEVNRQIFFHENGPVHPNLVVGVTTYSHNRFQDFDVCVETHFATTFSQRS